MATTAGNKLTLDPMGKCSNAFFSEITNMINIPVDLWELLGRRSPPTNSSKGEILCVAFKRTKLYLVVAYM
jgi:hypothetical protein